MIYAIITTTTTNSPPWSSHCFTRNDAVPDTQLSLVFPWALEYLDVEIA